MKLTAVCGFIWLFSLVLASSHATSEQCDRVFQAVLAMRGQLANFMVDPSKAEKIKKAIFYWTNGDIDDDEILRQGVCRIVSANSLDEMAAAVRIPRELFPQIYLSLKHIGELYKNATEDLLGSAGGSNNLPLQAYRSYIHLWNVITEARLDRFQVQPTQNLIRGEVSGCREMVSKGLRVHRDREWIFADNPSAIDNLKSTTGIDVNNKEQVSIVLCKLGAVRDLQELSAVINVPIAVVREDYSTFVAGIRRIETVIKSTGGNIPGIPAHVPPNFLSFLEVVKRVGLLDLAD